MRNGISATREILVIGLLSATLLSLEMIWTRLFSAEFYYTFAFLVLSLAIMGLGLGALALRLLESLNRDGILPASLTLTGAAVLAGPPLVFKLGLRLSEIVSSGAMLGKFVLAVAILAAPYFFGGIALATLFRRHPDRMPRLYMADLIGAAAGVLVAVWMMNTLGTPAGNRRQRGSGATGDAADELRAGGNSRPSCWRSWQSPSPTLRTNSCMQQREERAPVIYQHWDAMAKVKVYDYGPEYGASISTT